MNIFVRELKAHRKAIIIWSICMVLFVIMGMQKYNAISGGDGTGAAEFMKIMDSMPKFLQAMLGLSSLDVTTPIGYFGILFFYLALMTAIHAGMLGANIILKEERDKTVEFLMVKPVSRDTIITSKLMAALINVIIVNLAAFIPTIIIIKGLSNAPIASEMAVSMLAMFFIQLIFMVIGIGIAAINKNPKKSVAITMTILLSCFFLSMLIDMNESFNILSILTPFQYFDAKDFLINKSLNIGYIILTFAIITGTLVAAYKKYKRRDLNL